MISRSVRTLKRGFIQVKNVKEFETATKDKTHYVLQFTAKWCGPCKQLSPILNKKQEEAAGAWQVIKIDVDIPENNILCEEKMLQALPTLMFYKDGKEVERLVGLQRSETIDECIKMIL